MSAVYDEEKLRDKEEEQASPGKLPPSDEGLRHITGISPSEEKEMDKRARSKESLKKGEETDTKQPDQVGKGYSGRSVLPGQLQIGGIGVLGTKRRKFLAGGAVLGLIAAGAIALFLSLLPLKVLDIVQNLQNHFFATSESAAQKESMKLFSGYIRTSLKRCGGNTIDKSCNPWPASGNPVTKLYRGWRNAKLEDSLAKDYGLEFKKVGNFYFMKTPGMIGNGADISGFVNENQTQLFDLDEYLEKSNDPEFKHVSRSEVRQAVRDSLANETRWKRVLYRFKIGRLLEEKYGIKRCIVFCGTRDKLADDVAAKKNAAKLYLVERVLVPNSDSLGIVLLCLLSPDCHPEDTKSVPCEEGVSCALNDAPENPQTDTQIRQTLDQLAATFGIKDAAELTALYKEIEDTGGFDKYLIKKFIEKITGGLIEGDAATAIADKVPLIGWLNMAAQAVNAANDTGPKLKKLSYLRNAAAVVALYATYRTYADEVKSGKADATEVGSFVSSLGPVASSANLNDLKGGTASAEQTPLYNSLLGQHTGTGSSTYKCDGGGQPAGGSGQSLTCPEEKNGVGNEWFNLLHKLLNGPFIILLKLAQIWAQTVGAIIKFFGNIFNDFLGFILSSIGSVINTYCDIPIVGKYLPSPFQPYCDARSLIKSAVNSIAEFAVNQLLPSPFSENMSGGRTFDLMASGADVSGNDYAHTGLGGQELTDQQASAIRYDQNQQELQSYQNQSLFARLTDTNSQYSPVTKLAMNMPDNSSQAFSNVASFMSNPFKHMASVFSSIFNHNIALADPASTGGDPFGVPQYGYADGPLIIHSTPAGPFEGQDFWHIDHEAFWDAYCEPKNPDGSENKVYDSYDKAWNDEAAAAPNPQNGMPTNIRPNACFLVKAITGSDGALYDSSLLTPDDLAGSTGAVVGQ